MKEADLKERLTAEFRGILDGAGDYPPRLRQAIRELESDQTMGKVFEVLVRFGSLIETLQMLRNLDSGTVAMDRELQAVSQELGRILRKRDQALRHAVETETQRMAQIMREWIESEPSEEPVPDDWVPSTGYYDFDHDLYGLDGGQYLKTAVEHLGLDADVSAWADIPSKYESNIRFIIKAGMGRLVEDMDYGDGLFRPSEMSPERFWWHRLLWEAYQPYLGRKAPEKL